MESVEASVEPFPPQAASKKATGRMRNKNFMNDFASWRCDLFSHASAKTAAAIAAVPVAAVAVCVTAVAAAGG